MNFRIILGALTVAGLGAGYAAASTLEDVQARGILNCAVSTSVPGFSSPDANDEWTGFDVAMCRAVAAAVLGDPSKVKFVPTTGRSRFPTLSSGEADMLARTTTWTFSRDTSLALTFAGVNYYDGQGMMAKKFLGVTSANDLKGATVCVTTGTTTELNLADFFNSRGMTYEPVPAETQEEILMQYEDGACDVMTDDASSLAAARAALKNPDEHVILPEIISKEPLTLVVRHGDDEWADIVNWTRNALVAAEEFGITAANASEIGATSEREEVRFLLGAEGDVGAMLGLDKEWAKRAIMAGGNYGEIFAENVGENTPLGLPRGLNALWSQGGLLYAPPFRAAE